MPSKKEPMPIPKLVPPQRPPASAADKSAEDLEFEEYLRQLELAIENH
ncbi:MAG TPA: hypothetical protein VHA09_02775 [Nitrososphaera sp.]|nr:hypothetical protein [Nitrososphaera sp.]